MSDGVFVTLMVFLILGMFLFAGVLGSSESPLFAFPNQEIERRDPAVAGTVENSEILEENIEKLEHERIYSRYKNTVDLAIGNARSRNPQSQYLEIRISSTADSPIPITGMTLRSVVTGTSITLGEITPIYVAGSANTEEVIYGPAGSTLYVTTGISPIGYSFKVNTCSGFLEQFNNFSPSLRNECPLPKETLTEEHYFGPNRFNDQCLDIIERMSRCSIYTREIPINFQESCRVFIQDIHYNSCVAQNRKDPDFIKNDWRIFLGKDKTLWKEKREKIELLDQEGKIIDIVEYGF